MIEEELYQRREAYALAKLTEVSQMVYTAWPCELESCRRVASAASRSSRFSLQSRSHCSRKSTSKGTALALASAKMGLSSLPPCFRNIIEGTPAAYDSLSTG